MSLLSRWYARRIVNINVNIIVAGIVALLPVAGVVELVHRFAMDNSASLSSVQKKVIAAVTIGTDIVSDVTCFYILHWLANHWPKRLPGHKLAEVAGEAAAPGYFKDATLVQVERMVLSPLLYTIWSVTQILLMRRHVAPVYATIAGFCTATACIRTIHTLWMLRNRRRAKKTAPAVDQAS
jgi:hypothetical protein